MGETYEKRQEQAVGLLNETAEIAVFTGAGISTESGIADFRSPGGVWDRHRIVTFPEFLASAEARREYWRMKAELFGELERARPNAAHEAVTRLARSGRLSCLITQNIDGLHQDAGTAPELIIELHGTNRRAVCLGCGRGWPIAEIHGRLAAADYDPRCESCGEPVKPATVSFGQSMPEAELARAFECASRCDVMLMVGSSLQVEPAASIPPHAHRSGASLIFINRTGTPWDHLASVRFTENAAAVLNDMITRLGL